MQLWFSKYYVKVKSKDYKVKAASPPSWLQVTRTSCSTTDTALEIQTFSK